MLRGYSTSCKTKISVECSPLCSVTSSCHASLSPNYSVVFGPLASWLTGCSSYQRGHRSGLVGCQQGGMSIICVAWETCLSPLRNNQNSSTVVSWFIATSPSSQNMAVIPFQFKTTSLIVNHNSLLSCIRHISWLAYFMVSITLKAHYFDCLIWYVRKVESNSTPSKILVFADLQWFNFSRALSGCTIS